MWNIDQEGSVIHIHPKDDLKKHNLDSFEFDEKHMVDGELRSVFECHCHCRPKISYEAECVIITHASFDGREAMEEVVGILK